MKNVLIDNHKTLYEPVRSECSSCRVKGKAIVLRHPEQVMARPVGLMRQFQLEQSRTLLRVEEKSKALAVKGERHPTFSPESNPGCSSERRTFYHGATKPQGVKVLVPVADPET